jgi:mevalonate kinase
MGSSAATILSVMHAIANFLQMQISKETLFQLALEAENMQHGRSSGLDLRVALLGGCLYVDGKEPEMRPVPLLPMYLINTGMPITSTGQCVEKVAPFFKSNQLCDEFAHVTKAMDKALQTQSWPDLLAAIRENHRLLVKIGVVPNRVQEFISEVEAVNGVAKVCGAGAVAGNRAGALLVVAEDKNALSSICMRFGYNVIPISGELRGVHAA